jgi:acetyltransferase-like isoleucine patch superfamily enzyme
MYQYLKEKLIRHNHSKRMIIKWREFNHHNFTYLVSIPKSEEFFERVKVGKLTYGPINAIFSYHKDEMLVIGNFCSIGGDTKFILGSEHPYRGISTYPFKVKCLGIDYEAQTKGPIILEDDVWVGENVLVLSGVTLSRGTVVAAGSVIVKSTPPYSIVGGNPARVIKYRFDQEVIDKLLKTDLTRLTTQAIRERIELLYEPVNSSNVEMIIEELGLKSLNS